MVLAIINGILSQLLSKNAYGNVAQSRKSIEYILDYSNASFSQSVLSRGGVVTTGSFTPEVCRRESAGKERAKKERKTPPLRRASAQKQIAGYCPALWVDWCRDHRLELTKTAQPYSLLSRYVRRKENRQTLAGAPNLKGLEFGIPWKPTL